MKNSTIEDVLITALTYLEIQMPPRYKIMPVETNIMTMRINTVKQVILLVTALILFSASWMFTWFFFSSIPNSERFSKFNPCMLFLLHLAYTGSWYAFTFSNFLRPLSFIFSSWMLVRIWVTCSLSRDPGILITIIDLRFVMFNSVPKYNI